MKNVYVISVGDDFTEVKAIYYQEKWPNDNQMMKLCISHGMKGMIQCEIEKYVVEYEVIFDLKELNKIRSYYENGVIDTDGLFNEVDKALGKIGCALREYQDRRYNFDL